MADLSFPLVFDSPWAGMVGLFIPCREPLFSQFFNVVTLYCWMRAVHMFDTLASFSYWKCIVGFYYLILSANSIPSICGFVLVPSF